MILKKRKVVWIAGAGLILAWMATAAADHRGQAVPCDPALKAAFTPTPSTLSAPQGVRPLGDGAPIEPGTLAIRWICEGGHAECKMSNAK